MKRRDLLKIAGASIVGASLFPLCASSALAADKKKVLYFTRSAGFEHDAVKRQGDKLSISERILTELGAKNNFDVECTKDGKVFDGDLGQYAAIVFYTSGDLTKPCKQPGEPMSVEGKKKFLDAISAGKGFMGIHAATDSFRSGGIDPYIAMLGGEFISHGPQQVAKLTVASPKFPGAGAEPISLNEEWYAQTKFAKDLHVILVQETEGMKGGQYQRPSFPATWARMHGKGRVFYTSFGHRDDIWTNPKVQEVMLGGLNWIMGNVEADVTPNIDAVCPKANQTKN